MHEGRCNCGVHSARKGADHMFIGTNLLTDELDLFIQDELIFQSGLIPASSVRNLFRDPSPFGVSHLRMKLQTVDPGFGVFHRSN